MSHHHDTALHRLAPHRTLAQSHVRTRRRRLAASLVTVLAGLAIVAAPAAGAAWTHATSSLDQSRHVQQVIEHAHTHAVSSRGSASLTVEDLTWAASRVPQRWVVSPVTSRALWAEPTGDCVVVDLADTGGYVTAQVSVLDPQHCPGR